VIASKAPLLALVLTVSLAACGKEKSNETPAKASGSPPQMQPAPTPAPAPAPTPAPTPAPEADPYAMGFCEYTVEAGPPNKGGGGLNNVMSLHWMAANQQGRSLAVPLLINCGSGKQLNISSEGDVTDIPMAPKKYPIGSDKGSFVVQGPDAWGAKGELEITAWDASHVAGTFQFAAGDKKFTGNFDIKCPQPGNGVCK